jgi:predicted RNA-binding Zn-ribbon protein involved in translation (DUF1610 family)
LKLEKSPNDTGLAMLGSISPMKAKFCLFLIGLLSGCSTKPHYEEQAVKTAVITPLPAEYLLGAASLSDRGAICEAVIRSFAIPSRGWIGFIGFELYEEKVRIVYDPRPELLKHLRDLRQYLKPLSEDYPFTGGELDQSRDGKSVVCHFYFLKIKMLSGDEAELCYFIQPFAAGSMGDRRTYYRCVVARRNRIWAVRSKEKEEFPRLLPKGMESSGPETNRAPSAVHPSLTSFCRDAMKKIRSFVLLVAMTIVVGCNEPRADFTKGVPSMCVVHHTQMVKTNVPIEYGLVRLNEYGRARQAASTNSFPHAQECTLAGCIVGTATQAVIYVCPDCQKALQKWEVAGRENPKPF